VWPKVDRRSRGLTLLTAAAAARWPQGLSHTSMGIVLPLCGSLISKPQMCLSGRNLTQIGEDARTTKRMDRLSISSIIITYIG
jgi:hypothetical protein